MLHCVVGYWLLLIQKPSMFEKQCAYIFTFGTLTFILHSKLCPNFLYFEVYILFLQSSSFVSIKGIVALGGKPLFIHIDC
jgi:hypothetical protein